MQTLYGELKEDDFEKYKEKLHKELFWLLVYKDPKTKEQYKYVNFEKYLVRLIKKINGLNEILLCPAELISIMTLLQAALIETRQDSFDYQEYRRMILDAHSLVDKIHSKELVL